MSSSKSQSEYQRDVHNKHIQHQLPAVETEEHDRVIFVPGHYRPDRFTSSPIVLQTGGVN
jgi:hypothetical protein